MDALQTKSLPACHAAPYPRAWGHRGPCKKFCIGSKRRYILFDHICKRARPAHKYFKRERWLYSRPSHSRPAVLPHIHVNEDTEARAKNSAQAQSNHILHLITYAKGHGQHINTSKENDACTPHPPTPSLPFCPISTCMGTQGAMQKILHGRKATIHSI